MAWWWFYHVGIAVAIIVYFATYIALYRRNPVGAPILAAGTTLALGAVAFLIWELAANLAGNVHAWLNIPPAVGAAEIGYFGATLALGVFSFFVLVLEIDVAQLDAKLKRK